MKDNANLDIGGAEVYVNNKLIGQTKDNGSQFQIQLFKKQSPTNRDNRKSKNNYFSPTLRN